MVSLYPRIWRSVIGISILFALLGLAVSNTTTALYLAGLLILFIGIPHGAADHRLFQQLYTRTYGWRSLLLFYLGYVGLMGGVFVGWYLFPKFTLLAFLVLSAYHFGQGNFAYLTGRNMPIQLLYLIWGSWVIAAPILLHFDEAQTVLSVLLGVDVRWGINTSPIVLVGLSTAVVIGYLLILSRKLSTKNVWRELISITVLLCVYYLAPLFLGFAIYFALWHALPSAMDQIRFLFQDKNKHAVMRYVIVILPFSALAILSICSVFLVQPNINWDAYWSWLFACIAALTLPHMLLLDRIYERMLKQDVG